MQSYIENRGIKIIEDHKLDKDPTELIKALVLLKDEVDTKVEEVFINDIRFQAAKDASFRLLMNSSETFPL
jgi:hypothetical protein